MGAQWKFWPKPSVCRRSPVFSNRYAGNSQIETVLFAANPSDNHAVQKMTYYAKTGIDALEKATFVDVAMPKKVHAYFVLAQLYRNFFSPSIDEQLHHTQKAIDAYAKVIKMQQEQHKDDQDDLIKRSKEAKDMLERQVKTHQKSIASQSSASLLL